MFLGRCQSTNFYLFYTRFQACVSCPGSYEMLLSERSDSLWLFTVYMGKPDSSQFEQMVRKIQDR